MEHSRTGVKNVLPRTFSITREQQNYQGLIGSRQKDTETIVKSACHRQKKDEVSIKITTTMTKTDGNILNSYKSMSVIILKQWQAKNKNKREKKLT